MTFGIRGLFWKPTKEILALFKGANICGRWQIPTTTNRQRNWMQWKAGRSRKCSEYIYQPEKVSQLIFIECVMKITSEKDQNLQIENYGNMSITKK
jgi:hypothetical protein